MEGNKQIFICIFNRTHAKTMKPKLREHNL
nr:MAG TPA: hypothetical protein [Bacteriophage sp.]